MTTPGGLERARHVFLHGCGLPQAWAEQEQWRILETGFGLGLNFLATWQAWKQDPRRPGLLHFVSIEASPAAARDLLRSAALYPELMPLAESLAQQWFGLLPGMHRLVFEQGHVLLTLHVRDVKEALRKEPFTADSVFLDGDETWDLHGLKALTRHCRRGTGVATSNAADEFRPELARCGFVEGVFSPGWEPKHRKPTIPAVPGHCVVVGSGLAGCAVAASLARRGWRVTVLDAADAPAAGASGLPAGMLAPHHSPDDNLLSRLSRSGVRATLQQTRALLREGEDWGATGVLELLAEATVGIGAAPAEAALSWSRPADEAQKRLAGLAPALAAWWHEQAAWIKPASLVRAWLEQPGVTWRGNTRVDGLTRAGGQWRLGDADGAELARADLVVIAAALASASLLDGAVKALPLQPVRGQVSWGEQMPGQTFPPFPVNGNGHFIPQVPTGDKLAWFCGSTFDRGDTELAPRATDHAANLERLRDLLPGAAQQLAPSFAGGAVKAWTGVRCASSNRRPLLGELQPGLWVSTAMGSRGLTFAVLCAELLAARVHAEPLPLEQKLALALEPQETKNHFSLDRN